MTPELQPTPKENNQYSAKIIKFERRLIKSRLTENPVIQKIYPAEQECSSPGRRALDVTSDFRSPFSVGKRS